MGNWEKNPKQISDNAPKKPIYSQTAVNMMKRMGYVEGKGLGTLGQGMIFPIQVIRYPLGAGLGYVVSELEEKEKITKTEEEDSKVLLQEEKDLKVIEQEDENYKLLLAQDNVLLEAGFYDLPKSDTGPFLTAGPPENMKKKKKRHRNRSRLEQEKKRSQEVTVTVKPTRSPDVGRSVSQGERFGALERVKATSDVNPTETPEFLFNNYWSAKARLEREKKRSQEVTVKSTRRSVSQGESFGAVESLKATSDVNSPISGKVLQVNKELTESPGLEMWRCGEADAGDAGDLTDSDNSCD